MIPEWLWGKRICVFDLETDKIPTSLIYMNGIAFIDIDNKGNSKITPSKIYTYKWTTYSKGSLLESINELIKCDYICGHNICGFDIPQIEQHLGVTLNIPQLDTLIISKVMYSKPELFDIDYSLGIADEIDQSRMYALDAFGKRLGDNKLIFKEFDKMTSEMAVYCNQDVNLTCHLLLHLMNQENFPTQQVITIEHQTATIIANQTANGFYFDIDKGKELNVALLAEKADIARQLSTVFKPKFLKKGQPQTYKKLSKFRKYLPNNNYTPLLGTT